MDRQTRGTEAYETASKSFYDVIYQKTFLPTVGGMGGGADKFRWMGGGTDRQTDKETGIGTNQDGPTDPPKAMG